MVYEENHPQFFTATINEWHHPLPMPGRTLGGSYQIHQACEEMDSTAYVTVLEESYNSTATSNNWGWVSGYNYNPELAPPACGRCFSVASPAKLHQVEY